MTSAIFTGDHELPDLPRWAWVAFAARCARRFRPVCEEVAPDCPAHVLAGYDEYVLAIEQAAARAQAAPEWPPSQSATDWNLHSESLTKISFALTAAMGVHCFASRSPRDARSAHDAAEIDEDLRSIVLHMIRNLHAAAACSKHTASLLRGMRRDLQRLKRAVAKSDWTDETPVPPEFFGPL